MVLSALPRGPLDDRAGRRVLVAEDNERLAEMVAVALTGAGYEVVVVHDGYSALSMALEESFHVLLTDLTMPGLTGDLVAKCVRRVDPALPLVLMTASDWHATGSPLWAAVVRKPFGLDELVAVVDAAAGAETFTCDA
jgi:DNA-binding response OmpR family regulator